MKKVSITALTAPFLLGLLACSTQNVIEDTLSTASQSSSSSVELRRSCTNGDFRGPEKNYELWMNSWNTDESTTTISLERPDKGFSVIIPYNSSWGNSDCQLSPYGEDENTVRFGFAGVFEGGGAIRFNSMILAPARSASQTMTTIMERQRPDREQGILPPGMEPRIITVNGNTAVEYFDGGFCGQTSYEVIGKKFNYVFSSTCDVDISGLKTTLNSLKISD
jgi:hypothetical protein